MLDVLDLRPADREPASERTDRLSTIEAASNLTNLRLGEAGRGVRLSAIVRRGSPGTGECIPPVVCCRPEIQMVWSHTTGHVAAMEDVESIGDRTDKQFPGDTVCSPYITVGDPELTVSPVARRHPQPAVAGLVDLLPEALLNGTSTGAGHHLIIDHGWPGQSNLNAQSRSWRPWH